MDFTFNRVSPFALIFSIRILVDYVTVVFENIHRHHRLSPEAKLEEIPCAVNEIGSPTTLAALTVTAALLPMAFVSGLIGPYMSLITINSSLGMAISLTIAFIVSPWLALKLMKPYVASAATTPPGGWVPSCKPFQACAYFVAGKYPQMLVVASPYRSCPDEVGRQAVASRVAHAFATTPDILGVDTSLKESAPRPFLPARRQRADALDLSLAVIAQSVAMALSSANGQIVPLSELCLRRHGGPAGLAPVRLVCHPRPIPASRFARHWRIG
ncbi:MAG: multidrug efflux pump subunit AcrB [Rhodoferax sp.]